MQHEPVICRAWLEAVGRAQAKPISAKLSQALVMARAEHHKLYRHQMGTDLTTSELYSQQPKASMVWVHQENQKKTYLPLLTYSLSALDQVLNAN